MANYDEFLNFAIEMAKHTGAMIKEAFYKTSMTVISKDKISVDLVTETDQAVEKYILDTIRKAYPTHSLIAEESYKGGKYGLTDNPTWIVDPIDGTTNFVHRHPFIAVCIGLAIGKEVVMGVVYNPILDELFHAVKGKGSFKNGTKLSVASAKTINQAVISTNVGYDRSSEGIEFMTSMMKTLLQHNVQSMRSGGSAAVEICSVACGRLDAFYEFGIHPWDVAAATLIVTEAGGVALDPSGKPIDLESRRVLVGNKDVCEDIAKALASVPVPDKWAKLPLK